MSDDKSINIKLTKKRIKTLLFLAAKEGWLDLIKSLIKHVPINIDTGEGDYQTLLHIAAEYDNLSIAKYLVKQGININARDYHDYTALCRANYECSWKVSKFLTHYTKAKNE